MQKTIGFGVLVAAILSACGQGNVVSGTGGAPVCTQGDTRPCVGPGACQGGQICSANGLWGACECGATSSSSSTSSSTSAGSTSSSSSSSSTSTGGTLSDPPPPPPTMAPDGTSNVTFAVSKLYLGDTDPDGTPDMMNGWKNYGYNIDGVAPNDPSAFCQPVSGASATTVHQEGPQGQENAWGHLFLPLLLGIASDTSTQINTAIAQGSFTYLFTLDDLGAGATYNPLVAQYASGGNLGGTPKFDGTDVWPPVQGTTVAFAASYLTSNTWVSGASTATLSLDGVGSTGASLTLNIGHAVVTMPLDSAHRTVKGGMISGVISTADLQAQIQAVAGRFDVSLCSGATIQSILAQIAQASDILQDGTQDPTKICDGISIGLGFDGALVQLGTPVAPPPPPTNPCGDGG